MLKENIKYTFFKYNCIDFVIAKYMKLYLKCSCFTKNSIKYKLYKLRLNKLGFRLGFEIEPGILDKSTIIYHQNIVINGFAKIGKNVKFHGSNCVGNNGYTLDAPVIGNNVDIGFGAVIIGKVEIADDCIIGANAIVTKSFLEKGSVIAGCPAKKIK